MSIGVSERCVLGALSSNAPVLGTLRAARLAGGELGGRILTVGAADVARVLGSSIVILVAGRTQGAALVGELAFVLGAANLAGLLGDFGVSSAVQSLCVRAPSPRARRIVALSGLVTRASTSIAVALLVIVSDAAFGVFRGAGGWIGAITLAAVFEYPIFVFNACGRHRSAARTQSVMVATFVAGSMVGIFFGAPLEHILLAKVVSGLWGVPATWIALRHVPGERPSVREVLASAHNVWQEGGQTLAAAVGTLSLDEGPILALTYLAGSGLTGQYKVASTIARLMWFGGAALRLPLQGVLGRYSMAGDRRSYALTVYGTSAAMGVLFAIVATGIFLKRHVLVALALPAAGSVAASALGYLVVAEWFRATTQPGFHGTYMLGGVKRLRQLALVVSIVSLPALVWAAGMGGPVLVAGVKFLTYAGYSLGLWAITVVSIRNFSPRQREGGHMVPERG